MGSRICSTRRWKLSRAREPGGGAAPATGVSEPLFQGRVHLVDATFVDGVTRTSVGPADLAVLRGYLVRAVPMIERYCSQYGPVGLALHPVSLPLQAPISGGLYSDRDLQGWVNELADAPGVDPADAVLLVNPPGLTNTDARESGGVGVLGYHGVARLPYAFVNALGTGFAPGDPTDLYAEAVSHELAELAVDPRADDRNPEVCDGCGTNCQGSAAFRAFFDAQGSYLGSSTAFPPAFPYAYFLSAIARPLSAGDCPAPSSACAYPPPPTG